MDKNIQTAMVMQKKNPQAAAGDILRAAAYCRVSTLQEEQNGSFEIQERYWKKKIEKDPKLELVKIYGDRISGGSMWKRVEFLQMLQDARDGKIDIIYTKAISRFARNMAECLACVRELQSLGVRVIFENDGIDADSQSGEMLLSVLSAIAQQELNEKSQAIKWAFNKANKSGKPCHNCPYGYRKVKDAEGKTTRDWEINEDEAERVRLAFDLAEQKKGIKEIQDALNAYEEERSTEFHWSAFRTRNLFTREAYMGDLLTNKSVCINYLTKESVKNAGQFERYYITNHHPAIVSREQFERVRTLFKNGEMQERKCRGES
ncbi:MAG: recombinase family protein [Clostridiales bacterium]|nr:recombinase family protein [Clostridiales bacterium]